MFFDALERVLEELERVGNPRELALFGLALTMVVFGVAAGLSDTVSVALIAIGSGMFFIGIFLPVLSEFEINATGFKAKLRERDEEVRSTLEPHAETLLHAAEALAGNPQAGKELLERALVETYLGWQEAKSEGPAEAVIRRIEDLAPSFSTVPAAAPSEASS